MSLIRNWLSSVTFEGVTEARSRYFVRGVVAELARGLWSPNCFEVVRFSQILMFRRKIFGLLPLVKIKVFQVLSENL